MVEYKVQFLKKVCARRTWLFGNDGVYVMIDVARADGAVGKNMACMRQFFLQAFTYFFPRVCLAYCLCIGGFENHRSKFTRRIQDYHLVPCDHDVLFHSRPKSFYTSRARLVLRGTLLHC